MPPPLDPGRLRRVLGTSFPRIDVVARTGSTNADLLAAAAGGAPDRTVLAAEHQDAGRGRRTRTWQARPSEGLTVSVLLRPREVPSERRGWAPLLAGLALARGVDRVAATTEVTLKWPNDLLLGEEQRKGAGTLVEADRAALVVGLGVNVDTDRAALPDGSTSLAAEGVHLDRTDLLVALLRELADLDDGWRRAGGDAGSSGQLASYRGCCATLGRRVRVTLPGDRALEGTAVDVDATGRLLVRDAHGDTTVVSAGDVVHLRLASG